MILDRLNFIENKYEEMSLKISDPSVMANQKEWQKLCKEHSDMQIIVNKFKEFKKTVEDIEADKEMLKDKIEKEFKEMVEDEIKELSEKKEIYEEELRALLLPKDANDEKNVFVEIRGGAGGDEAALFAANLFRMYTRYAERHRLKVELMSANETDIGGFKEVVFMLKGNPFIVSLNMKVVFIEFKEFLILNLVEEYTHLQQQLQFCLRLRMWILLFQQMM